jgi:type II secretory pathway predicted ATPase ExeA
MTLETHFGLQAPPFPRTAPDAALLRHHGIEDVLARLHFALARDSIATLVAESGCGKSTALCLFARSLDAANYHLLNISLTTLAPFGFLATLCGAAGLKTRRFKGETAALLLAHLRGLPKRTVLLVDEAHLLPDESLEDLRLLTADDFDRKSPFALVLVGQPLLRERLAEPRHWAMAQRVAVRLRLRPLTEPELALFIDRHLEAAGATSNPFDAQALAALFQHSRGIPRLIQNLALNAMLAAMSVSKKTVDETAVQQAVVDLEES